MESVTPSLVVIALLVFTAFIAGYIDTLVGGGGLITIPALMLAGVPPIYALGTNKLQAVAGTGTATLVLLGKRLVKLEEIAWLMASAFVGSVIGAVVVQYFDVELLRLTIPIVITLIAAYFIFVPSSSLAESEPKVDNSTYGLSVVPGIGFYDGMFGPGTGSFFAWAGVSLRGQPIVLSTMAAKALNFATNLAALVVFAFYAKVLWKLGLVMMLGQSFGAYCGARSLLKIEPQLLRYLVIAVCFIILLAWAIR